MWSNKDGVCLFMNLVGQFMRLITPNDSRDSLYLTIVELSLSKLILKSPNIKYFSLFEFILSIVCSNLCWKVVIDESG